MDKKTFLHDEQLKLGAKMVPFAGWKMPVQFASIIDEHNTVREKVGIFDVSHMGEFFVSGKDSLAFLQKLVPQNIAKLVDNKAVYCQLTNKQGGMIDDLIIYKLADENYLLIVNASRIEEDLNWILENKSGFDVQIDNQSDSYSLFAVQGPLAADLIEKIGLPKTKQPEFFTIQPTELLNINTYVSRTGYTGEDGFEILVKNENAVVMWNHLLDAGKEFGIKPIGLGARDTLRLEAALHLYGNDMDENTTPVEAVLTWSVPKNKAESYNGKDIIMSQIENGVSKKLVGFEMIDKAIARHDYEIYYNNEKVGKVTSGGVSPSLSKNIGLGYVATDKNIKVDSLIQIMIRDKLYNAKIVKRPFVDKKNKVN